MKTVCDVCFRHCNLKEGETGFCRARINRRGRIVPLNYGKITSIALDPVAKKPFRTYYPFSKVLSLGSYGCNLRCPFCQNHTISMRGEGDIVVTETTPEIVAGLADRMKPQGNIGVAYTYNEPMCGYEFIRDTAKIVKSRGMKNLLITNGTAEESILREILPYIDAMNIDLKSFDERIYKDVLKGDLQTVKNFIKTAAEDGNCRVEITSLIVPGMNDSEEEMRRETEWIASLDGGMGKDIALHISRYFPMYEMNARPTDIEAIERLCRVAEENLKYVYRGNC